MKKLLKGGRIIDHQQKIDTVGDIVIEGSKILGIASSESLNDCEVVDCSGKIITPGLTDIHVHLREPGQEWKETISTGAEAAVAGGFTHLFCMPNTKPINDNISVTEFILEKAKNAACHVYPIGAITKGSLGESLAPFGELSDAGCLAFSDDGRPVMNAQIMRRALEYCSMLGRVLTVHEEDTNLSDGFAMNESALSLRMGLKGMPDAAENVMIARDIELSRLTGGRVHFCHVSTARGVTLIRRAKEDGIKVTAEVAPHYLYLDETEVEGFNTQAKMSMPLRTQADIEALLEGLRSGVIDCVASDHAPHEADSKNVEFDRASFGILGLQTTVSIMFDLVHQGKITIPRFIESLTTSAWSSFDLKPPSLKTGEVANISILDPNLEYEFNLEKNRSKSSNSPLLNKKFKGANWMTIVSGDIKYRHGD